MTDTTALDPEVLLEALDEQQRAAAEALTGSVCVLAGAGTGKTRTITHRIAYGVATGVFPPKRVMALTFTTRAAAELRGRLAALGAPGIAARTFHSAALAQLNHFWPQLMGTPAPSILDAKARLVAKAAEGLRMRLGSATLKDAASEIEFRKTGAMSFERYAAVAVDRALPEGFDIDAMVALQQRYETVKDEQRMLDFEDVLLATTGMIESEPAVATEVREQYRFFTVDEYQDVSPAQQGLLEAWLGDHTDVCVVGDASQTIYSFAGAQADYLLRFGERPGASVVRLEHNYRSVDGVVRAANALMTGRRGALTLSAVRRSADPREPPRLRGRRGRGGRGGAGGRGADRRGDGPRGHRGAGADQRAGRAAGAGVRGAGRPGDDGQVAAVLRAARGAESDRAAARRGAGAAR